MLYFFYALAAAAIVALDQISKVLVRARIPEFGAVRLLPGVVHLTYVQNTGAAFSSFLGQRWLLVGVTAVFLALVLVALLKNWMPHPLARWSFVAIIAGGIGNLIDRVAFGYVTDMFAVDFMDFAVFNVADIFVVCGCIGVLVYALFFAAKDAKKKGDAA